MAVSSHFYDYVCPYEEEFEITQAGLKSYSALRWVQQYSECIECNAAT